jgi:type I restriction enzyme, R subunit
VSAGFAESHVEQATLAWLSELGYSSANGLDIGPDGDRPERASYGDVLLVERLRAAIARLNPTLEAETRAEVLAKMTQAVTPSLIEENRRLHRYMIEGVPVEVRRADGSISGEQVRLIDFDNPDANDWLAVNQCTVIENKANRRPDVVLFVNGMPLGVVELKNPCRLAANRDWHNRRSPRRGSFTVVASVLRAGAVTPYASGASPTCRQ